ncbi:hypothetical protein Ga0061060_11316 [Anoxybacillus suryakundensis]|uniref:Uncharacterized protein n=1 Tax=Anoxybacillus suryakundensis TaxID=1325335 RepID=A0A0K6GQB1_9BACL|nr:hypothetical protein Ga0061060_11316 [Anoxybacillus suryakundensis]
MNRLAHHQGIHKFLTMLRLPLYFSKPVMKHLAHIVDAMMTKGFSGTLTDLHHGSFYPNHRTTLSHFFTKSPCDEETLFRQLQKWVLHRVESIAKQNNHPFLFRSMIRVAARLGVDDSNKKGAVQSVDCYTIGRPVRHVPST